MRQLNALTQNELATQAGVQRQTIGRLEHGASANPTTVRRLADVLHCAPSDLYGTTWDVDRLERLASD